MRCIEISINARGSAVWNRLIETWDVLKSGDSSPHELFQNRLIETWDVLK